MFEAGRPRSCPRETLIAPGTHGELGGGRDAGSTCRPQRGSVGRIPVSRCHPLRQQESKSARERRGARGRDMRGGASAPPRPGDRARPHAAMAVPRSDCPDRRDHHVGARIDPSGRCSPDPDRSGIRVPTDRSPQQPGPRDRGTSPRPCPREEPAHPDRPGRNACSSTVRRRVSITAGSASREVVLASRGSELRALSAIHWPSMPPSTPQNANVRTREPRPADRIPSELLELYSRLARPGTVAEQIGRSTPDRGARDGRAHPHAWRARESCDKPHRSGRGGRSP